MVRSELARCDHRNVMNPGIISRVLRTFISLKVNDITLFLSILTDAAARPYNYPPSWYVSVTIWTSSSSISEIGAQLSTVLPRHLDSVANVSLLYCIYNDLQMLYVCLNELKCHIHRMDPSQVGWKYAASQKVQLTSTAIFAHKACSSVSQKCDFFRQICESLVNQRSHVLKYDAPKLMEVMSMHNSLTEDSFHIICRDIYRVISCFEPVDYQRTARVLVGFHGVLCQSPHRGGWKGVTWRIWRWWTCYLSMFSTIVMSFLTSSTIAWPVISLWRALRRSLFYWISGVATGEWNSWSRLFLSYKKGFLPMLDTSATTTDS